MNTKLYAIIFLASLGLIIVGAVIGGILESSGTLTKENLGAKGITIVLLFYGVLFCLLSFAAVPLFVRAFIVMQGKIGNSEVFLVKWIRTNEEIIVYCFWGLFVLGLGIAFSLSKNEILKYLK